VVDDHQEPTRAHSASGVAEDPRPIQPNRGMKELCRHKIERATGKAVGKVVLRELDPITEPVGIGVRSCALQCGVRDVDGDDAPPAFGEPTRIRALPAPQIERRAGCQRGRHLSETNVDATAPDPVAFAVVLLPVRLGIRR
jgi:hypothetical protein